MKWITGDFPFFSLLVFFGLTFSGDAFAWGRHDLITKVVVAQPHFNRLRDVLVTAEPIENAAPAFLKEILPKLDQWSERFHREHDSRYSWGAPTVEEAGSFNRKLSDKEMLLWRLENNIRAPLDFSITASDREDAPRTPMFGADGMAKSGSAADILTTYVEEPDAQLDNGLNIPPYLDRMRKSMSLFYDGSTHTHAYRHFYVPNSLIPPLSSPRGIAPYRAALYAQLAIDAFKTGHRYWGYRFLSWALHYAQDVTQPWHTVFVPDLSFLRWSRAKMKQEISAHHFLTEAFSDSWLLKIVDDPLQVVRSFAGKRWGDGFDRKDPWWIAKRMEESAKWTHDRASGIIGALTNVFAPIIRALDEHLRPLVPMIRFGDTDFPFANFDFSANGKGATDFIAPIWSPGFSLSKQRDDSIKSILESMLEGVRLSTQILEYVLEEGGESSRIR